MEKVLMTTIMATLLIMVFFGGVGLKLHIGSRKEIVRRRRMRDWPAVAGRVDAACIEQEPGALFSWGKQYRPLVFYSYQVGGRLFQSSQYKNTSSPFSRRRLWSTHNRQKAEEIANAHPQGRQVRVYYNPRNAQEAYLALDTSTAGRHAWR